MDTTAKYGMFNDNKMSKNKENVTIFVTDKRGKL